MTKLDVLRGQTQTICLRYLAGENTVQIARTYKVSPSSINKRLRWCSVPIRKAEESFRKNVNHNFFDAINTEEKAYWLGMLAADGNVGDKRSSITLSLSEMDSHHVQKFAAAVASEHTVGLHRITGSSKYRCDCTFISHQMKASLAKHGVVPRKTYTLQWCHSVPDELKRHYVRGFFDGDGSVYSDGQSSPSLVITIGTASYEFAKELRLYLIRECGMRDTRIAHRIDRKATVPFHVVKWTGSRQARRFAAFIYDGATVWLERKRDVFVSHPRGIFYGDKT